MRKPEQHFSDAKCSQNGFDGSFPADMWTISMWNVSFWFLWSCANPQLLQTRFYYLFIAPFSPPCCSTGCAKSLVHSLRQQQCRVSFTCRQAVGIKPGPGPRRDNDVCFVCSFSSTVQHPPRSIQRAPSPQCFNNLASIAPSSPPPFSFTLNLFLWITDWVLFSSPALPPAFSSHSVEVAGEESLLV